MSLGKPYRILHFDGPFKGSCSDVSIMRSTILPQLRNGEKAMCDKGYLAEPLTCLTPPRGKFSTYTREQRAMYIEVSKIRQLNERAIGRIMEWGVMVKRWNLSFDFHELCARNVAKLTQFSLYTNPLS